MVRKHIFSKCGSQVLLIERGLYPAAGIIGLCQGAQSIHQDDGSCCCQKLLSLQLDFASECSALQHAVEKCISWSYECADGTAVICDSPKLPGRPPFHGTRARHMCLFLPKFHCELNPIERFWAAAKHYARSHCLYTLAGLRETVPLALSQDLSDVPPHLQHRDDLPVSPVFKQRRWFRISWQYGEEYRKGSDVVEATKNVKSLRHHDTGDKRMRKREAAVAAIVDRLLGAA